MTSPFDPNYKPQLAPLKGNSRAESRMKQSLRRTELGNSFDRQPLHLTNTQADITKAAIIRTPSCMRPKVTEPGDA